MATILSAEFNQITMQTQYIVLYMTRQVVSADTFDLSIVSIDSLEESLDKIGCVTRPNHLRHLTPNCYKTCRIYDPKSFVTGQ